MCKYFDGTGCTKQNKYFHYLIIEKIYSLWSSATVALLDPSTCASTKGKIRGVPLFDKRLQPKTSE